MEEWDSRQRASPLSPRAWVVLNVLVLVIIIVPPRYGVQVIIREKKIHILRVSKGSQSVGRTGRGLLNQQRGSVSLVLGDPLALWGGASGSVSALALAALFVILYAGWSPPARLGAGCGGRTSNDPLIILMGDVEKCLFRE